MVIRHLKDSGLLFKELMFEHSYPFCWRCDTPLLYYARSSWFIKMTEVRDRLLANNASVNWIPPTIGTGRMGNFLENVIDWGISRERYWGTPIPVWICKDCGHMHVVGSKQELKELGGIEGDVELHKPYVDPIVFKCPECGGEMHRTPEVMDCWFDSGSMPFAQWHYPFENKDIFDKHFPADFISEAVDQTRGWFYTLLAVSTLLFDRAPFKNCIVLGHVNDKDGVKMSKHKGNVVDPWSVLDKQGADAVRWYFYSSSMPWLPTRFSAENVSESQRKFLGTLWNTYSFFVLYAEIDKYDPREHKLSECKLSLLDKWILSRLNSLVKSVDDDLNDYKITESARDISDFVDELSNWYVRRSRERFWGKEMSDDKEAAYTTLYHVLVTLSRVVAPFVPFVAEQIYRNLVCTFYDDAPESVHLTSFPVADAAAVDKALEADMDYVLKAVALGRACRNKANIKNRQPLSKMFVAGKAAPSDESMLAYIADEINVDEVVPGGDAKQYISYEIKPQLKTLGPRYGKHLGAIRGYLSSLGDEAAKVVETVKSGKDWTFEADGAQIELSEEDLLIGVIDKPGFSVETDGGITVILDTTLTPQLIDEGIAREITSRIQTMRKEAGFEVVDHIRVGYVADGDIARVIAEDGSIAAGVLCDELKQGVLDGGYTKEWELGGATVTLSVEKVK